MKTNKLSTDNIFSIVYAVRNSTCAPEPTSQRIKKLNAIAVNINTPVQIPASLTETLWGFLPTNHKSKPSSTMILITNATITCM